MPNSQGVVERAYAEALKAAKLAPEDAGTVAIGRRLAQLIDLERGEDDEAATVVKLAAEYRQILTALRMTPAARIATTAKGGATVHDLPANPLEAARDAARARRAAAGDAPAS